MSEAGLPRERPSPPSLAWGRGEAALRVTFDTNVLLSLFVFADSRFAPLRGEVEAGRWQALTSPACLAEYRRVLAYPLFALSDERQAAAYDAYRALVKVIDEVPAAPVALPKCRDKDDQKFLELARDGLANCLVTADKALLRLRRGQRLTQLFQILTPDEALARLPT
ncbi:MAG: putative toxin-antitoxin system toxin component, PIN family [Rhodocyclaceae bacterium]|jgi:putative PIN family toxin of toxin-antitoxin system|nr:putative toxin-antitoxin system toxin component, PIN family [Rhodocyclaceae bacterium]